MRALPAILAVSLAACGDAPERCLDREFFRDRDDLYAVARIPDGYVVDARDGLIGYGDDDAEHFRIDVLAPEFVGTRDGRLTTVAIDGEALVLAQWSASGAALGELASVVVGPDAHDIRDAAISADGVALVAGGSYGDAWWTRLEPGHDAVVTRSDVRRRAAVAPSPGGDSYALESTWYDEDANYQKVELVRLGPDDVPRWSTLVFDHPDAPLREAVFDLWAVGDAIYVATFDQTESGYVIRRYDPDGALTWTRIEPHSITETPGRPVARDDGTLLWVDDVDSSIRVRRLDDAGDVVHECTAPSDPNHVTDVELDRDELFVVTVDRITRLRLGPPIAP